MDGYCNLSDISQCICASQLYHTSFQILLDLFLSCFPILLNLTSPSRLGTPNCFLKTSSFSTSLPTSINIRCCCRSQWSSFVPSSIQVMHSSTESSATKRSLHIDHHKRSSHICLSPVWENSFLHISFCPLFSMTLTDAKKLLGLKRLSYFKSSWKLNCNAPFPFLNTSDSDSFDCTFDNDYCIAFQLNISLHFCHLEPIFRF